MGRQMSEASAGSLPAGCLVDPEQALTITFDGRDIPALAGQSIAAALHVAGVRIFTRSFKYHRPRGLLCLTGDCPNCLMQVDGKPNVRTCIEPARQGQVVCHQNAWPSLTFDVLNVFDKLHRFLPVGFYYKRFHKPRWLWPIFEHVVRHIAGLGRIDVDKGPSSESSIATGSRQRPLLFPNNDLPGVFLADAVLRLARFYGVRAGRRAVLATNNDDGHHLAHEYKDLGIEVTEIVDTRNRAIVCALGRKHVKGDKVVSLAGGPKKTNPCDFISMAST